MYNFLFVKNREKYINSFNPSQKPVILLIKGLIRSHKGWMGLEEDLSEKFDVICIDLPGVGLSKNEKLLYSVKEISDEIYNVLQPLNIKELYIMSTSFGTLMTLELTKMFTNKIVKGVILTSANHTGIGLNRISMRGFKSLLKAYFQSKEENIEKFIEFLIGKKSNGDELEEEVIEIWKKGVGNDIEELGYKGATIQSIAAGTYLTKDGFDYIRDNLIPIKIIIPDNDLFIPVSHQKDIYRYVMSPVSQCIFLKNGGHDFFPTHKDEVFNIVYKFAFEEKYETQSEFMMENISNTLKTQLSNQSLIFKMLLPLCFIFAFSYLYAKKRKPDLA